METQVKKIRKRGGKIVNFNQDKITSAILKAAIAVGGHDKKRAEMLSEKTVEELNKKYDGHTIPNVEDIQDIVEKVLIENGHAKTAKAYILYRQKKIEIRNEKEKILNKKVLDDVDKRFSVNALRVLAFRYLKKNDDGEITESLKELFQRVAVTMALPELLYDSRIYDKNGKYKLPITISKYLGDLDMWDNKLKIGKYSLTKWHLERLASAYEEYANKGKMKVGFDELIASIKNGTFDKYESKFDEFFELMTNQFFMPNTPTIINSGRKIGMLSACFTLDVDDNIYSIMDLARDVALIQKAGGGTGMNFSKIRPSGDLVKSTMGKASGPISFMKIIDTVSDVIKQGGVRRGANMGILEVWHPNIEEFITSKNKEGVYENFNISVGMWEDFWKYLAKGADYPLINPKTKKVWKYIDSKNLLHSIAYNAWLKADPGLLFFDNVNKRNVLINARGGKIRVTNPCGEEPLYPYESCNLASINVAKFVIDKGDKKEFDFDSFRRVISATTRGLDNIISMNKYPLEKIDKTTKETRRIGLGLMGVADLLFKMGIKYNSKEGFEFMRILAENLTYYAYKESIELSKERGHFTLFNSSDYKNGELPIELYYKRDLWTLDWDTLVENIKKYGLRNAMVTTNAPTGSISMIADTSNGIEPMFSLVFEKHVTVGSFFYVDRVFEKKLRELGIYSEDLLKRISEHYGSVQSMESLPKEIRDIFVTSMDLHWMDHVVAQAVLQTAITDSISKTINMPNDATVEEVKQAYILAHEMGCKGTTVYRDGSKTGQVLNITSENKKMQIKPKPSSYAKNWLEEIFVEKPWVSNFITINEKKEKVDITPDEMPLAILSEDNPTETKSTSKTLKEESHHVPAQNASHVETCPLCGGKNLVYEAGCVVCKDCGWSECLIS